MPMIGIFTQAHVGYNEQVGHAGLDFANCLLDDAFRVEILQAYRILRLGNAEKDHSRNPQIGDCFYFSRQEIRRPLIHTRHGGNLLLQVLAMPDK